MPDSVNRAASARQLQTSLSTLHFALEMVPDAIVWTAADGCIQGYNPAFERLLNCPDATLSGQPLARLLPLVPSGQSQPLSTHPVTASLVTHQSHVGRYEFDQGDRVVMLDIVISPLPCPDDHALVDSQRGVMLLIRSLTPQASTPPVQPTTPDLARTPPTQADAVLRDSEQRFWSAFANTAVGVTVTGLDGTLLRVNASYCQMLGYTEAELLTQTFQAITHPDDLDYDLEKAAQMLAGQLSAYYMEKRYFHKQGHIVWGLLSVSLARDLQQQPLYFIAQVQDISDRKRAELALQELNQELEQRVHHRTIALEQANHQLKVEIAKHQQTEAALRKSEERFRRIFDVAPIAISLADAQTYRLVKVNQAHRDLFGYSDAELATMTHIDLTHPDDVNTNLDKVKQLLDGTLTRFQIEKRFVKKNGDGMWANLTVTLIRDPDGCAYTMGMIEDISERKCIEAERQRTEMALRESEAELRAMFNITSVGMGQTDALTRRFLRVNAAFCAITGYTEAEMLALTVTDINDPDDRDRDQELYTNMLEWKAPRYQSEKRYRRKDGSTVWVLVTGDVIRDSVGRPLRAVAVIQDVTERRQVEEALWLTQFSIDHAAFPIWWVEPSGKIYYVNDAACRDLEYPREWIVGKAVYDFNLDLPQLAWTQHWQETKELGSLTFEARLQGRNRAFPVEVTVNYVELNGKEYHCSFVRDITNRKLAEAQLRASLVEKDVLLKEVHHRVKNNLQTVYSLLNLQANSIQDPNVLLQFRDSQHRIKAMALIHEKLYQTASLAKVNFADYVNELGNDLIHSYSSNPARIHLRVELSDVELSVDLAIPCGFIINELVTNAIKHAFPNQQSGEICIGLSRSSDQQYQLLVADNGVGIPANLDWQCINSLGLQLVRAFVYRLRGELDLDRSVGSAFRISFPCSL